MSDHVAFPAQVCAIVTQDGKEMTVPHHVQTICSDLAVPRSVTVEMAPDVPASTVPVHVWLDGRVLAATRNVLRAGSDRVVQVLVNVRIRPCATDLMARVPVVLDGGVCCVMSRVRRVLMDLTAVFAANART